MEQWTTIITQLGFPIGATIAMGFFIYKSYNSLFERNNQREDKLYETISQQNIALKDFAETNSKFVEILNEMQENMSKCQDDIADIKNILHINNRKED